VLCSIYWNSGTRITVNGGPATGFYVKRSLSRFYAFLLLFSLTLLLIFSRIDIRYFFYPIFPASHLSFLLILPPSILPLHILIFLFASHFTSIPLQMGQQSPFQLPIRHFPSAGSGSILLIVQQLERGFHGIWIVEWMKWDCRQRGARGNGKAN
jgi:hypothetical protein